MREDLIEVFTDTQNWIKTDPKLSKSLDFSIQNTKLYKETQTPALPENYGYKTNVEITTSRSFEAAKKLTKLYPSSRIAVHNFASATSPGGGVKYGSRAQEECLCRCSTLYPALQNNNLYNDFYKFHKNRRDVKYTDACIYTPDVLVVKTDTSLPTRMAENDWYKVDVLTCAAPNLRKKPNNSMNPGYDIPIKLSDVELMELHVNRARHMFSIAVANNVEILVLGAFGCGAFQNNPFVVAQAYKQVLSEFNGFFKHIEFAVYCSSHNTLNYDTFKKVL